MAYYPNNTVPISTTGPHANRTQELPARAQRTNQVQYVEERVRNGLSPLAVAGVAALLTQLDTMQTLPGVSVSLVTEVAGYRRTLTCQNNAWDGHDLTHQFLDERSTTMLGPSQGTRFEQEASLCMVPASVATMPPPHMVALPPPAPNPVPMTPTYSGSPAFGTSYRAPHMVLQTTTNAPVSDREPSGSRLPPIPNSELMGRSTSEQAVIVALQAVANYPNSTDFVRAVEQRIPGLATYLQAAAQPAGCDPLAPLVETASMDMEIVAGPSNSASAASGTQEEAGRKRLTEETVPVTPAGSVTESPTSRPPPDKRADVPRPQLKSVVIPRPPYLGREAVRRYNWLVRKDKEIPVRAELANLTKQIGAWPAARTVERTIPQIHFASGIEPMKLPVGLRCIVAIEAINLKAEVDAAATTYAYWYQTRFATRTLAEVARELNCPLEAFCTSLGLGWNLEVLTSEFSLTSTQTDKLLETIGEATVGEILALALAMGPTKFVAGPLALLADMVIACDLTVFYSYLVLAQGQLRSLTRWGHLMTSKDQQDYSAQLERMRASIQHWLYSTLVFASGLFVGVDQSQPLHNSDQQISRETAGFPMPQQVADLTLAEVEDFVAAMAPVLTPIFGAVGVCRYPTKPLATAVQVHMVSFSTYLRGRPSLTYPRVIHAVLSGEVVLSYGYIFSVPLVLHWVYGQ